MAQSQSSAPLTVRELAPQETAMLVLRYLQENNFEQASRAFAVEADSLLKLVQPPQANQKVKGLHAVLNEYVVLDARARRRAAFERSFGDDADVRGCLSKLTEVMDDYLAAKSLPPKPQQQQSAAASSSLAVAGGSSAAAGSSSNDAAAAGDEPGSASKRKRKSAQPQRVVSSRSLFGGRGGGGGGGSSELPPAPAAAAAAAEAGGLLPGAFSLHAEQLGEAIAKRINNPAAAQSSARGGKRGMQDAASENGAHNNSNGGGGGGNGGGDAVRADDLSVDQIVNSLLDDPKIASGMLSSFSARPSVLGGGGGVPSRAATAAPAAAAPKPRLGATSGAAPAFPTGTDIDSFLNRLHGKEPKGT